MPISRQRRAAPRVRLEPLAVAVLLCLGLGLGWVTVQALVPAPQPAASGSPADRAAGLRHDVARIRGLLDPPYGPPPERRTQSLLVTLRAAGYERSEVRPARSGDPAAAGSLLYSVQVAGGCVTGVLAVGGEGADDGPRAVGTLPDGTCPAL
jgi:hypothetical protein